MTTTSHLPVSSPISSKQLWFFDCIDTEEIDLNNRLIKIGNRGFSLGAIVGWHCQTPSLSDNQTVLLYLSGVSEPMCFEGKEGKLLLQLLENASQDIAFLKIAN
ncbi:MAG: hypothetical protein JOZ78_24980 [Chroococcidiopsidaceae cyanobacterium CP_BM_ER_R8_30]|nr:hypothetical protein [Chroococcidiopsidaceae cyanobacterium CP_BM_ER_R8_30]